MAIETGTSLVLSIAGNAVALCTSASITIDRNMLDVSTKASSGNGEYIYGQLTASIDFEGLVDFSDTTDGVQAVFTAANNKTQVAWTLYSGTTGWSGNGLISSVSTDATVEDVVTYSGTITVTGAITFTAPP